MEVAVFFSIKKNQVYDENGILLDNSQDLCDCLDLSCKGCHFPCPKCGSQKCGAECRCGRKWIYEHVEVEGTNLILKWPQLENQNKWWCTQSSEPQVKMAARRTQKKLALFEMPHKLKICWEEFYLQRSTGITLRKIDAWCEFSCICCCEQCISKWPLVVQCL